MSRTQDKEQAAGQHQPARQEAAALRASSRGIPQPPHLPLDASPRSDEETHGEADGGSGDRRLATAAAPRAAHPDSATSTMSESADKPASSDSDPPRADLAAAPLVETAEGKPEPTEALMAELRRRSEQFETASPEEILRWATDRFGDRLTMGTAFGPEGMVIIDLLSRIAPRTHLFNLDTGYQFAETLTLRDRIAERYGMEVELLRPELSVAEYEAQHGGPVYKTDTTQCCFDRKIRVLQRAAMGRHAWISAIRRDQSENRRGADIIGWDRKFGLVKVNPLANCTKKDIWRAIMERNIPYNPLHDQGYTSIGCWPCTRAITFGEDERAGRWSGTAKTECGLHTPE